MVLWLAYWLTASRYALLDDALIHLHYADYLNRLHFITFDGVHHTFGTSSLLYVSVLAFLREFVKSALLPKAVSDIGYVTLLTAILLQVFKLRTHPRAQWILGAFLLCLLSPMSIRWLTDGMETSWTNLLIVLLALAVKTEQGESTQTRGRFAQLVAFGAILIYLRIELCMLVGLCCLSILAAKAARKSLGGAVIEAAPLTIGAVLAMVSIRLVMGHFLPDTASAKASGHFSFDPVTGSLQVMLTSVLFGAGAMACWAISLVMVWADGRLRNDRRPARLVGILLENSPYFVVVALSCLRGQAIQGARYFIWAVVFSLVSNVLRLAREEEPGEIRAFGGLEKGLAAAFCVFFVCALPFDWRWGSRAMRGRSQTFLEMRAARLDALFRGKTIVAGDVGFVTYFTEANTCDTEGLVNGLGMAAKSPRQRAETCAQQSPVMLFITVAQEHDFEKVADLNSWKVCRSFDFTNVNSNDRHYVTVPAGDAERVCNALGVSPLPISAARDGAR